MGWRWARPAKSSMADVFFAFAREVGDHGEGAEVGERVGGQIEHRGGGSDIGMRGDGHQHVSGVRDGAVGQHALDVGLLNRGEVADDHGGQRADPDDRLPAVGDGSEGGQEDAQQNRERGGFGADREECRRPGRARPDRRRAPRSGTGAAEILKPNPTNISAAAAPASANEAAPEVCSALADLIQIGGTGDAVDPGDAVEQERGGERTQQKIFERGFVVARVVAQVAGEDVGRDGGNLQADEDHDQLIGGDHDALADDAEQDQGVEFAARRIFAAQIFGGADEDRENADADHQHAEEGGEAIDDQHVVKAAPGSPVAENDATRAASERRRWRAVAKIVALVVVGEDGFQQHDQHCRRWSGSFPAGCGSIRRRWGTG